MCCGFQFCCSFQSHVDVFVYLLGWFPLFVNEIHLLFVSSFWFSRADIVFCLLLCLCRSLFMVLLSKPLSSASVHIYFSSSLQVLVIMGRFVSLYIKLLNMLSFCVYTIVCLWFCCRNHCLLPASIYISVLRYRYLLLWEGL